MLGYVEKTRPVHVISGPSTARLCGCVCPGFRRRSHVVVERWMMELRRLFFVDHRDFAAHGQLVNGLVWGLIKEVSDKLLQLFVFVDVFFGGWLEWTDRRS